MNRFFLIFILLAPTISTVDFGSSPKHYCYVRPFFGSSTFNFTTVQDDSYDSIIRLSEEKFLRVHFCRPLKDTCNGNENYAVCLHDADKEIGVGKEPPKVAIELGKIMFRYVGDKCNNSHDYTVDIEMKCSFSAKGKMAQDLDAVYDGGPCNYQIFIETEAACAERKETTCKFKDKTGYYNLGSLKNLAENYEIKINSTLSVILNVCHSLIYGHHFQQCDHGTMICLANKTNTEAVSYTRLGNINNDVRFSTDGESVFLDLTSDTPCRKGDATLKTIWTTIEFVCPKHANNKFPKYISGLDTCHYKFRWITTAACSRYTLTKLNKARRGQSCTIEDPTYKQIFDLSYLEGKIYTVATFNPNIDYEFSICKPLSKTICNKPGTGVCKHMKGNRTIGLSKGLSNTHLMYDVWSEKVILNYTDGMACGNNQRSYTEITLTCTLDPEKLYIDDDKNPCAVRITLSSPKVCNRQCTTPDYKINLKGLKKKFQNFYAKGETNAVRYQVNVCQPLFDDGFTTCHDGTGICKEVFDDQGNRISETNLGTEEYGLQKAEDGRLYLRYVNGSTCEEDKSKQISSEITFICNQESQIIDEILHDLGEALDFLLYHSYIAFKYGIPVLSNYSDCKYDFTWKTEIACPRIIQRSHLACRVQKKIKLFDLRTLIAESGFKEYPKINDERYGYLNISVCGKMHRCNGTLICEAPRNSKGYISTYLRTTQLLAFKFENETLCKKNPFYKSMIEVWCNLWDFQADSFLLKEGECSVEPQWPDSDNDDDLTCKAEEKIAVENKNEKEVTNITPTTSTVSAEKKEEKPNHALPTLTKDTVNVNVVENEREKNGKDALPYSVPTKATASSTVNERKKENKKITLYSPTKSTRVIDVRAKADKPEHKKSHATSLIIIAVVLGIALIALTVYFFRYGHDSTRYYDPSRRFMQRNRATGTEPDPIELVPLN